MIRVRGVSAVPPMYVHVFILIEMCVVEPLQFLCK